jgi:predicted outer membrane repeat protein
MRMLSLLAVLVVLVSCAQAAFAATFTVTDLSDNASDSGSLRYAVNTAVDGDQIVFASGLTGTILLANGPLTIGSNITIAGPGIGFVTISGNHAGAVFNISSGATVNISGLSIINGTGANAGGIYNAGALTVNYCVFTANHGNYGGAIENYFGGTLWITSGVFSNNSAVSNGGGAIGNYGALSVSASTFSGNVGGYGGGIENEGMATVGNSTFSGNTGSDGGGIFTNVGATLTASNDTFSGNSGPNGDLSNYSGGTANVANSILADGCTGCNLAGPNLVGGTPDLGPLQFNGSLIQTMLPLPGSPAIGAGSGSTLSSDERGFIRPTGSGVASDLGAVQTNYLTVTNLNDSGVGSLRQAILSANSDGSGDIVFQSGLQGTIGLASILPSITANLNMAGPGSKTVSISGQGTSSVIDVPNSSTLVNLSGVSVIQGNDAVNHTAAVSNSGILTVTNIAFSSNQGTNGGAIFSNGIVGVQSDTFSSNTAAAGGAINSQGILLVRNSTFFSNQATGNGGAIENSGTASVADSTITGNKAPGTGAGLDNASGTLIFTNSIVTANLNSNTSAEDDYDNCTQVGPILTGTDPKLAPLDYYGVNATMQTMLPLPGSPAIQLGDATQLSPDNSADERGFARLTAGKLDLGAAQTNYTSVQFVQQPTTTFFNATIRPSVTLEVLETNTNLPAPNNTDAVNGIPITLTLEGTGALGGTLTQTTAGGVASFADLMDSTPGTGNTLATSLTVTPPGLTPATTLTATSNAFDIDLLPSTANFNPVLPASVVYGVAPLTLKATVTSSGTVTNQTVTFHVDSGPATLSGNVLTITGAGSIAVEVDAAANGTYAEATPGVATIAVTQAASQLSLTSSATQAPVGSSVTLTATATSTAGTPTGTVTFLAGGTTLGSAPMNAQGVATLAATTLPVGSNTITANYAGDTNFSGSQAQLSGTIVVGTPGFAMTSSTVSLSVQAGSTGNVILTLIPAFGYTGILNLACAGMPGASTCAFQPATVQFDGSGNPVQVTVTMKIATAQFLARGTKLAEMRPLLPLGGLPLFPAVLLWFPETDDLSDLQLAGVQPEQSNTRPRLSRWFRIGMLLLLGMGLLGMLFGCAGQAVTPTGGQYNVTITAAGSGAANQTVAVQLNVTT